GSGVAASSTNRSSVAPALRAQRLFLDKMLPGGQSLQHRQHMPGSSAGLPPVITEHRGDRNRAMSHPTDGARFSTQQPEEGAWNEQPHSQPEASQHQSSPHEAPQA